MSSRDVARRGTHRLRVAVELQRDELRVTSVWFVDGPAVQRPTLVGTHAARIEVDGRPILVQAFDDPRVSRGIASQEHPIHSFGRHDRGTVELDVPLTAGQPVRDITVRIAELRNAAALPADADGIARLFEQPPRGVRILATLGVADLQRSPDFASVAGRLGLAPSVAAGFEIYRDRDERFRWRLRRPDGEIVADSGGGYDERSNCEADLRWLRSSASEVPVRSLDLG